MTKKLYYDCPIEAAYMEKNFEVKLLCYPTEEQVIEYESKEPWDWRTTCVEDGGEDVDMVGDAIKYMEDAIGRVYVHPDSLHIFEPQERDLVTIRPENSHATPFFFRKNGMVDYANLPIYILMRNNKPFIMPEKEVQENENRGNNT